ncbi:MAG: hypothetical protein HLUCCA24_01235 [Rhodobacteraceae bacterium HLUCCA24]|nr:MAG: hypothetical protein HLUCCA24_01235 [Rhodobacteraceae bacterium HLUCCA24]
MPVGRMITVHGSSAVASTIPAEPRRVCSAPSAMLAKGIFVKPLAGGMPWAVSNASAIGARAPWDRAILISPL